MDTEQIVDLILREIQAFHPAENMFAERNASCPVDSVRESEHSLEPTTHRASIIAPNEKPCKDFLCSDKLHANNDTQTALLKHMQATTSARIGIGKCGSRMRTATMLQFRADHATAKDAVLRDVPEELLSQLGLFTVQTLCADHDEYLARPDLGRRFSRETLDIISQKCRHGTDVQIYAAGGLSSTAITSNLANILPVLTDGLKAMNLTLGDPFYVRFARVPSMEEISETLQPKVICVLIGERPGLATAESMSAYLAYHATVGMSESQRTVVSNIHKGGVSAVEAGAYLVELIGKMVQKKTSGVDFAR